MSNVCELLMRHPDLLTADTTILGNQADLPNGWLPLVRDQQVRIMTSDLLTANSYQALDDRVDYGVPDIQALSGRRVVLLWPKAKAAAQTLVTMLSHVVDECFIVGANDAGGKSIKNALKGIADVCTKMDSARHCSLWHATLPDNQESPNWLRYASSCQAGELTLMTLPGVFGHGKVDRGTALLLEHVPAPGSGSLLDVGAGSGIIGLSMKHKNSALNVTLADVDAMALRSCQLNSARLNLPVDIVSSDGLSNIEGRFDFIFCNPPFHQGKRTDYDFAERLLREACRHLTADGQLWIVANRHLPYEEWAASAFRSAEVMVQQDGFKIICATNG